MTEAVRDRLPPTTLDGLESIRADIVGQWVRRAFLGLLSLVVIAGLCGFLGVRTSTAEGAEDGWHLSLDYPAVARAGLDVTWRATVTQDGDGSSGAADKPPES